MKSKGNSAEQLKSRIKLATCIVLLGFMYAGYLFWEFQTEEIPRLETERAAAEARLASKQAELRKLQTFAQNIESVKQELRELNLQLEAALESMPRSFNLSALLRKLNLIAQNSGVELSSFKPRKAPSGGGGSGPTSFYTTIFIDFAVRGSFTQTLVFFDQVARLKRIVHVEKLEVRSESSGGQPTGNSLGGSPLAVSVGPRRSTASIAASTEATIQVYRLVE